MGITLAMSKRKVHRVAIPKTNTIYDGSNFRIKQVNDLPSIRLFLKANRKLAKAGKVFQVSYFITKNNLWISRISCINLLASEENNKIK